MRRLVLPALLLVLTSGLAAAQVPPRGAGGTGGPGGPGGLGRFGPGADSTPAPTGTSRIRGRVFSADGTQPVRVAQIRLSAEGIRLTRVTTTDASGQFEFPELPAGHYRLTASKGGFVTLQFGQRRPFEPGTPVEVGDAQTVDVSFTLPRGSVIAGRLTDDTGEPVAQAVVTAARYLYGPEGQRRLQPAGISATTDDLGQFRLYGLMPGDYVVSATMRVEAPFARAFGRNGSNDASDGYATTYYPGTISGAEAQPVHVGLGQEVTAPFALVAGRMARVSGAVIDSQGRPASGGRVTIASGQGGGLPALISGGQIRGDGSFALSGVPPGDHLLSVRLDGRAAGAAPELALMPLSIGSGGDLTGIAVTTTAGASVTGTVVFEGASAPDRRSVVVVPTPLDPQFRVGGTGPGANGRVGDDGRFQLSGLFGRMVFGVSVSGSSTWVLKSVRLKGQDVTDMPVDFAGGESATLQVVLTDRLTDLSGAVKDSRGMPLDDYVVVFLPAELREGAVSRRFVRTARPEQDGRYHVRGLPPGRYLVAAVDALEQGREWDPELQAFVRMSGRSLRLDEGRTDTLDLELARP